MNFSLPSIVEQCAECTLDHTYRHIGAIDRDAELYTLAARIDSIINARHAVTGARRGHVLHATDGGHVVCELRYFGGDRSKPFYDCHTSFAVVGSGSIGHIGKMIIDAGIHAGDSPVVCRFYTTPDIDPGSMSGDSAINSGIDSAVRRLRLYAGRISSLKAITPVPSDIALTLDPITSHDYVEWYLAAYRDFHTSMPHLADLVPVSSIEEMNKNMNHGMLYMVNVEGIRAGIFAARPEPLLGMASVYIWEELLLPDFRGRGLAPVLQRRFIETLEHHYEYLWGTIDDENVPSQRTAIRAGREPIRDEWFVTYRML